MKNINIKNLQIIFALLAIKNASGRFLDTCIKFVGQRLKFTPFEGSIPYYTGIKVLYPNFTENEKVIRSFPTAVIPKVLQQ